MNNTEMQSLINTIRAEAEAKHAKYPQYKNHWDGWFLVRITRKIETKAGLCFDKGEIALATHDEDGGYTVYSRKTTYNTLVGEDKATVVTADEGPLSHISVDLETGALRYSAPEGFKLDEARMWRATDRNVLFTDGDVRLAIKHAIHEQLSAHRGMASLRRMAR